VNSLLKNNNAANIFELLQPTRFRYQQTYSTLKIKAGFSTAKLCFSPQPTMNYPFFDPSICYLTSGGRSWSLSLFVALPKIQRSSFL